MATTTRCGGLFVNQGFLKVLLRLLGPSNIYRHFYIKASLLLLKYQHVMFCCSLNLSCLFRRWPEMRRTTIRTHPNRSGGKLESTDDATQNSSTHLWSRWVSPSQWTCRGYLAVSVFGPERGSLRRVWGWRLFKHPGWTLMSKETKPVCSHQSSF